MSAQSQFVVRKVRRPTQDDDGIDLETTDTTPKAPYVSLSRVGSKYEVETWRGPTGRVPVVIIDSSVRVSIRVVHQDGPPPDWFWFGVRKRYSDVRSQWERLW